MNKINSWSDVLKKDRPLIFGILNCTPDSFSDGGKFIDEESIKEKMVELASDGSDVIDFGGESTRPGADEVSFEEQSQRISPVLNNLNVTDVLYSLDTRNAELAKSCVESGVQIINDVSGGTYDSKMMETIESSNALCVLMHMRGTPKDMKTKASYSNLIDELCYELEGTVNLALSAGVHESKIMLDPGIGFAKSGEDSLRLIKEISKIKNRLGFPILIGHSRKSFIDTLLTSDAQKVNMEQREWATHYLSYYLFEQGIDALRVHNPKQTLSTINFLNNFHH